MSNPMKDRISSDLQKAKSEGGVRADRIREIVRIAVSQSVAEIKAGSSEIGSIAKDAIATVIDNLAEKGKATQEEITASVEGVVEGISHSKREEIAKAQSEVDRLQAHIDAQQQQLETEIDGALVQIQTTEHKTGTKFQALIEAAINAVRDREEFAGLRQQYAKLRAKLAILDANLAARYGERYEDVKRHLENAKTWYDETKVKAEASGIDPVQQKQAEFERKIAEAGAAVARKEQQLKQRLQELWHEATKL
jgi:hypothetical protein